MIFSTKANQDSYPFILPKLPYSEDSFAPHFSIETFDYHYKKHHQTYVTNLNNLLENSKHLHGKTLEEIILSSSGNPENLAIFNNAAQVWNHTFFWHSIKPSGGGKPSGKIAEYIERDFSTYDNFVSEFKKISASQFGSGWSWLVLDDKKLKILKTSNAETPITQSLTPLIACDVWEHAYYIDYRNKRPDYLSSFIENMINWDFAESNLK